MKGRLTKLVDTIHKEKGPATKPSNSNTPSTSKYVEERTMPSLEATLNEPTLRENLVLEDLKPPQFHGEDLHKLKITPPSIKCLRLAYH